MSEQQVSQIAEALAAQPQTLLDAQPTLDGNQIVIRYQSPGCSFAFNIPATMGAAVGKLLETAEARAKAIRAAHEAAASVDRIAEKVNGAKKKVRR